MVRTTTTPVLATGSVLPDHGAHALTSHVSRLDLTGFRNYAALRLDAHVVDSPVVILALAMHSLHEHDARRADESVAQRVDRGQTPGV